MGIGRVSLDVLDLKLRLGIGWSRDLEGLRLTRYLSTLHVSKVQVQMRGRFFPFEISLDHEDRQPFLPVPINQLEWYI